MKYLVALLSALTLAMASASGQSATLAQAPRTKAVEISGSEALTILGIQAFKTEVRFTRPQKVVKVALVSGSFDKGVSSETESVVAEYQGMPAVKAFKVGLSVQPEAKQLALLVDDGITVESLPDGFRYDYSMFAPDGIYDGGLVIFAYEPRSKGKQPRTKAECLRYLGMRLYLQD